MSIVSNLYAAPQSVNCSFSSLASGAYRCSASIDNTATLYIEALVTVSASTPVSGTSSTGVINLYAYGTNTAGANWTDNVPATDSLVTLTNPTNCRLIGVVNANVNNTNYVGGPFSVSPAFGGMLADHWGLVVQNVTGATLAASGCSISFQGVQAQLI